MTKIINQDTQDGITITAQNLSRFKKRLQKALQEAGVDISYSSASQILAKTCGKKSDYELSTLLKELEAFKEPKNKDTLGSENTQKNAFPVIESDINIAALQSSDDNFELNLFNLDGNLEPLDLSLSMKLNDFKNKIASFMGFELLNSSLTFTKAVGALEGSFYFMFKTLYLGDVSVVAFTYDNFKLSNRIGNYSNEVLLNNIQNTIDDLFKGLNLDEQKKVESNMSLFWKVSPGLRYEIISSPVFDNIQYVTNSGHYKEEFIAISHEKFLEIKKGIFSNFYIKGKSGLKKSKEIQTIDISCFDEDMIEAKLNNMEEVVVYLKNIKQDMYVFQVLSHVENKFLNLSKLSFCFFRKIEDKVFFDTFGNRESIEVNDATDLYFFKGVMEKQNKYIKTPVNHPHFRSILAGFNS